MLPCQDLNAFHLYADRKLGALSTSITVVKLNVNLDGTPMPKGLSLESYIDNLIDTEQIQFHHEFVEPRAINRHGYDRAVRYILEQALPLLSLKSRTLPSNVYTLLGTPVSLYYNTIAVTERTTGIFLARWIGWFKRQHEVYKYWHDFHPEYGWDKNNGVLDRTQALACLEHGYIPAYHYIEALKDVPLQWVRELKHGNIYYMYGPDYLSFPPQWWRELFGPVCRKKDYAFFKFMTPKQRKEAKHIVAARLPRPFQYRFIKKYPPL